MGRPNTRVKRTCEVCTKIFEVPAGEMKRPGRGRFCSQPCRGLGLTVPIEERFLRYIGEPLESGCIPWIGCTNADGYGIICESTAAGKNVLAHRLAYQLAIGPIPDDLDVLHYCDWPPCINPVHLFTGTRAENIADMIAKGRGFWQPNSPHRMVAALLPSAAS